MFLSAVRPPPVSSGRRLSEQFSNPESDTNDGLTQLTCELKSLFAVTLPYSAGQDQQVTDQISLAMSALDGKRNVGKRPKVHLWTSTFRVWDWFASQIDCLKTERLWLSFSWIISQSSVFFRVARIARIAPRIFGTSLVCSFRVGSWALIMLQASQLSSSHSEPLEPPTSVHHVPLCPFWSVPRSRPMNDLPTRRPVRSPPGSSCQSILDLWAGTVMS
jgi:hypothetical protein